MQIARGRHCVNDPAATAMGARDRPS
jgi:hypothetical protein